MNYKKIYESNLKENLSEPEELMGETLKKISEWIGSIWELKELPKDSWRTDKPRYKIRGFEIYPKKIYIKFSFMNKDDDGHIYEDTLEDWFNRNRLVEAQ